VIRQDPVPVDTKPRRSQSRLLPHPKEESNSTVVSDYGTYDTRTVEKAVKAVVTVKYAID